jgi:hypothetical protein
VDLIITALNAHEALSFVWRLIVVACALYLMALGLLVFLSRSVAVRFLNGHAASPQLNLFEASLRFIAGLGFMGAAQSMHLTILFFWFGALLAATALPMLFLYPFHKRFARLATPFAIRVLPAIGVASLFFSAAIGWALRV